MFQIFSYKKISNFNKQKGAVTIILSLLVLSVLLVIGLSVSLISLQRIKMAAQMGQSVTAYYAAESGMERCLYQIWQQGDSSCSHQNSLSEVDASYTVAGSLSSGKIESRGLYQITSRKIEVNW